MAIGTTAALLGSAALGAAGSIASSSAQKKAAQSAANASQAATDQSIAEQRRQFDQSRQDMMPWQTAGAGALGQLAGMYGLSTQAGVPTAQTYAYLQANPKVKADIDAGYFGGPGNYDAAVQWHRNEYGGAMKNQGRVTAGGYASPPVQVPANGSATTGGATGVSPSSNMAGFFASPDYQFRMNEAMRALTARNAALGIQDSGAAQKAALQQSGNLASGEFNNYANRLASIAGVGQTAAQNTAQLGSAMAGNIGNALANNAANLSSSYQNRANAQSGLYGSLANLGGGILGYYGGAR